MSSPAVVALGGGHGLAASLQALRRITDDVSAVVTVADNGGSSGRLRTELGSLPPGDLRMALSALAAEDEWSRVWCELFQHRFPGDGSLGGHAVGNLVLTGLADVTGSHVAALDLAGRLLGIKGRVLPLTTDEVDIVAAVAGLDPTDPTAVTDVRGQVEVATTPGKVVGVRLVPSVPTACPEAVKAVLDADFVVLGPGSLFTSLIPHLMVPELRQALERTRARRVLVLNLAPQQGETTGFSPAAHLDAIASHAPDLAVDHIVADTSVLDRSGLMDAAVTLGAEVHFATVGVDGGAPRHDPGRLAAAYAEVLG